ncbi:hypothetical protein PRIC2_014046 [Phytophthora ramorum]
MPWNASDKLNCKPMKRNCGNCRPWSTYVKPNLQAKDAKVNHGVTEVVGERLRDPAADISAEIKQSLERSVKTIIELISVAVDCNAQTDEEIKTEIENRGNVSEDDGDENYDELSGEDRYAQQRMRDALIRA